VDVRQMKEAKMRRLFPSAFGSVPFWAVGLALLVAGCSASYMRRSADQEAYRIIQRTENRVLGRTNAFTIDTPYSGRKPQEISPAELIDDRLRTNRQVLTIEQAIDLALRTSRDYQKAKETLYSTALRLSNTRYTTGGRIEPSSATTASLRRDSSGNVSADVLTETGVTMSKLFKTGGRLTVDMLNSVMLYYTGRPELSFSKVSGSLVQPLLRGFGANSLEVEALTQAERDMVYAVRSFSLYQDQFQLDLVNSYFRLLQQKDAIRNRYTNYLGRVQSTQRLEARSKDRERLSDVDQARQAELTAKNNYVDAASRYQSMLDQFKVTLGLPLGEKVHLDDAALDRLEQAGLIPALLDPALAFKLAVTRQRQMLNYIDQYEDSQRRARLAADRLKPGLTLNGGATLESEAPADYTKFDPNHASAFASLRLDLPLDQVPRRNAYRAALVAFESDLRTFTSRLDTLKSDIQAGLRTLEQRRLNYEIQRNALALANRRVESTTLLLEAGRAEVRDLVDAQDAQIAAQNSVTAALVDYQQTRLQLMLDIGALDTSAPQFWLEDHLAAFLPAGAPAPTRPTAGEQGVLPPDDYFNN
jgi:outer membrane protein TolC